MQLLLTSTVSISPKPQPAYQVFLTLFFFCFVVSEPFYVCSWGIYLNDLKDTKRVGFGVYFNHEFLTKIKTQPFLAYPKYP
jgi:hypothetical protein